MLALLPSKADKPNPLLADHGQSLTRLSARARKSAVGADNMALLSTVLSGLDDDHTGLVLIGGRATTDFRLRVAQSHGRQDMTAGPFSHVALCTSASDQVERIRVHEVCLAPPKGFGFAPDSNGLQEGALGRYRSPEAYPNVAAVRLPVPRREVLKATARFEKLRVSVDTPSLIVEWLAFVWGAADTPNPLLHGHGIPSAVAVETVLDIAGYILTPNIPSSTSCPEAIWQSVKWWHETLSEGEEGKSVAGRYWIRQRL